MRDTEAMWRAFAERDERFAGEFIVGVKTTGIYCRPGCPARTPLRKNVAFFVSWKEAEEQGFRPCKRCKPRLAGIEDEAASTIRDVCKLIEAAEDHLPTLRELADHVGLSPTHLQKSFKKGLGLSPKQYGEAVRLRRFKQSLQTGTPVTDAVYEAGYGSSRSAYEKSNQRLGMTPATYGAGGKGATIRYSIVPSRYGKTLVARTSKGICSIAFGDRQKELVEHLYTEFPRADIQEEAETCPYVQTILNYLEGEQVTLDLPLDVHATAFQQRVWELIRDIPYGGRKSYSDLAAELGRPTATRAVAQACAKNNVPLVIPCHRVVGKDGKLHGFRWGTEMKQHLLDMEQNKNR